MDSAKQHQIYAEFEEDANEIVFGQKALPDRSLTDKEVTKRRKTILKLYDQKLKFELVELMERQKQINTSNVSTSPIPTISQMQTVDSNTNYSSIIPSSNQYKQNVQSHSGPIRHLDQQQNWQSQYQSMHPKQQIMKIPIVHSWPKKPNSCQVEFQYWQTVSSLINKPTTVSTSIPTNLATGASNASDRLVFENEKISIQKPDKLSVQNAASTISVDQSTQKYSILSHQDLHSDSFIQPNHPISHKQPMSSETMPFQCAKSQSESVNNDQQFCTDNDHADTNKDCIERSRAPLCK